MPVTESLDEMLHQQLVPVVQQELMAVVKANPRGCGKFVDIGGLPRCRCFLRARIWILDLPGPCLLARGFGMNAAACEHYLSSLECTQDVLVAARGGWTNRAAM
jgi:hypothetical protein